MHIGTVAILEGPPPPYDELAEHVRANLPQAQRYRQKAHFVPLALGLPVWVDDPHFNLSYHLRRTALPEPGSDEQLRLLVGRVMSQQLDRHKPLWEMWMIEGLSEHRWALLTKVHHSVVDGVSGAELTSAILDEQREPELPPPEPWRPERQPSDAELVVRALGHPGAEFLRRRAVAVGLAARRSRASGRDCPGPLDDERGPASATHIVAQRPDRTAPPLGLGAVTAVGRQEDS